MSANYLVLPFDAKLLDWARECGVPTDGIAASGRDATFDALLASARTLLGHSVEVIGTPDRFQIKVESVETQTFPSDGEYANTISPGIAIGPRTSTLISGSAASDGTTTRISFHGDVELMLAIVRELTRSCGPQAFCYEGDGVPWIVATPDSRPIGPEPWVN